MIYIWYISFIIWYLNLKNAAKFIFCSNYFKKCASLFWTICKINATFNKHLNFVKEQNVYTMRILLIYFFTLSISIIHIQEMIHFIKICEDKQISGYVTLRKIKWKKTNMKSNKKIVYSLRWWKIGFVWTKNTFPPKNLSAEQCFSLMSGSNKHRF